MPKIIDITNKKFGKLTAIRFVKKQYGRHVWLFKCDCGNLKEIRKSHVMFNKIKSCGCNQFKKGKESPIYKHGMSGKNFYERFKKMEDRCNNPKNKSYKNYGDRGIKCEWKSFEEFKKDMYKSYLKYIEKYGRKRMTLERKNNNGNYSKNNCIWIDIKLQERNRRDNVFLFFKGEKHIIPEWAEILGVNKHMLYTRYQRGWSTKRILTK